MSKLLSRRGVFLLFGGLGGAWLGQRFGRSQAGGRGTAGHDPPANSRRLRPPGALPEEHFLAACLRCGQCVEACPAETLELADLEAGLACGAPFVTTRAVGCNLCAGHDSLLCILACPTDALQPVDDYREVDMGVAIVDRGLCLSWQGTTCRACWHACPYPNEAITLDWKTRPTVVAEACIGCGLCDHVCLTEPSSIRMLPAVEYRAGSATHIGEGSVPY